MEGSRSAPELLLGLHKGEGQTEWSCIEFCKCPFDFGKQRMEIRQT